MIIYLIYMPDLCSIYKKGINVFFFLEAPLNTGEGFAIFKVQAHLCWVAVPWKLCSSGLGYLTGPYCSRNSLLVLERGVCFSDMKGWLVLCSGCACSGCSDGNAMEEICQLLPARAGGAQHPDHIHLTVGGPRDGHQNVFHGPNGQCTLQLEWLRNWVGSQSQSTWNGVFLVPGCHEFSHCSNQHLGLWEGDVVSLNSYCKWEEQLTL